MSGKRDKTSKDDEQSPDPQSRDFWYDSILQGGIESVEDQIKRRESDHRNKIGLTIVTTICYAFLTLLGGGLLIFLLMVATGTTYNVPLIL